MTVLPCCAMPQDSPKLGSYILEELSIIYEPSFGLSCGVAQHGNTALTVLQNLDALLLCIILCWCIAQYLSNAKFLAFVPVILVLQCCLFCSVACVAVLLVLQCCLYCSVAVLFVLQYCLCCSIACVAVLHNTGQKKKCSMVWHTLHCRHFKRCFRSWIFILSLPSTCSLNCIFCFFTYICKIKHNFWRRQYAWLGLLLIAKKRT